MTTSKLSRTKLASIGSLLLFILAFISKESNALLLTNLIGCSSFNCRLSAVESDVSHLKMQMARMTGDPSFLNQNSNGGGTGMNGSFQRPNQFNQGQNQNGMNNGQLPNQALTQATNSNSNGNNNNNSGPNRVNLANLLSEYPQNQQADQLRRVQANNPYQNGLVNQFP